jgi:hypothetical protein
MQPVLHGSLHPAHNMSLEFPPIFSLASRTHVDLSENMVSWIILFHLMGLEEHVRNDSFHAFSLFPYHVGFAEAPFYNS